MASDTFAVEVAYAEKGRQMVVEVDVGEGATVADAIRLSAIERHFPGIDPARDKVGIFGQLVSRDRPLSPGDRVEIYRPLAQHPMEARRKRAVKR